MFKRFMMAGLLSISMVMILYTSAKALSIGGFGLRFGSLICEMLLEREKSDPKDILAQCILEPVEVEVVCEERKHDHKWLRGDDDDDDDDDEWSRRAPRQIILVGQKQINKRDFKNGIKEVNIPISTRPLLDPDKCEEGEIPTDAIVLDTKVRFEVFECIGGYHKPCSRIAKRPLDSVRADCELPSDDGSEYGTAYSHDVPEPKTEGTEYDCDELKPLKHRKHYR